MSRVIVFTRTKHRANRVAEHLGKVGVEAEAIHGNKSQGARQRALDRFRSGDARVLVARSEEHTSELQSLMRISYAVFCLKKKKQHISDSHIKINTQQKTQEQYQTPDKLETITR